MARMRQVQTDPCMLCGEATAKRHHKLCGDCYTVDRTRKATARRASNNGDAEVQAMEAKREQRYHETQGVYEDDPHQSRDDARDTARRDFWSQY